MKFIYPIIFYVILTLIYTYSKGMFKVKKEEEYKKWADTKGRKVSKAVVVIGVLYTVFFIIQSLS